MPPPPMATCLTFYPRDNNILAIGMDDFSIIIYNASTNKVYKFYVEKHMFHHLLLLRRGSRYNFLYLTFVQIISKLEGHTKRVSDLAFSISFDLLVSIGVNDQVSI